MLTMLLSCKLTVFLALQVYESLRKSGELSSSQIAYFDRDDGAELLYEMRLLSVTSRPTLAAYIADNDLDPPVSTCTLFPLQKAWQSTKRCMCLASFFAARRGRSLSWPDFASITGIVTIAVLVSHLLVPGPLGGFSLGFFTFRAYGFVFKPLKSLRLGGSTAVSHACWHVHASALESVRCGDSTHLCLKDASAYVRRWHLCCPDL